MELVYSGELSLLPWFISRLLKKNQLSNKIRTAQVKKFRFFQTFSKHRSSYCILRRKYEMSSYNTSKSSTIVLTHAAYICFNKPWLTSHELFPFSPHESELRNTVCSPFSCLQRAQPGRPLIIQLKHLVHFLV